ncbi:carbon-nitrogen hydrolase family protein [Vibrio astriarenae]|jgi:predicted amidohydrolase|uniref:Carbon-nitrogen hydrolase family protein n=1 Tax=Vibrio agarivorans TaxID=153622 RepID=A0ABT7XWJ6_9VIBR|nr:carbon-nitrogen hydrolase family protein [Vibrio agarivorans]MDN2480161.1 carbon-nitrogen hydrolase family protein [Vibrio agarivorans]
MERVGIIQMTSGPDPDKNLAYIKEQVFHLAKQGVKWIITPENALVFGRKEDYHRVAEHLGMGPLQLELGLLAKEAGIWLIIGSMPIKRSGGVSTTTLVFNDQGLLVTHYDKLHMFDVEVNDAHRSYRESETFTPGSKIETIQTPFGHLGLSICYDLRFPQLYSELIRLGANILLVPAAFTAVTGQAHWRSLLMARAIENQAYVVAVNQTGVHPCGRETWGHSMIISPWGEVLLELGQRAQNGVADIDLSVVNELRQNMPVIQHSRFQNRLI